MRGLGSGAWLKLKEAVFIALEANYNAEYRSSLP
jgi:hypothetical protein